MKSWHRGWQVAVMRLGLWFGFDLLSHLVAESLWFDEVGYATVFWLRLETQAGIGAIVTALSALFLLGNLAFAQRQILCLSFGQALRSQPVSSST